MNKRPRLELKRGDDQERSKLATRRRRPTGPRTQLGKQRSKLNATKYGIFSRVLLLRFESKQEFDELVSGLLDHYQLVGTLEETLVDQLAVSLCRLRRLLIAEKAEIANGQPVDETSDVRMMKRMLLGGLFPGVGSFHSAFLYHNLVDLIATQGALTHRLAWQGYDTKHGTNFDSQAR
jgi:hypothetical protein